MEPKSGSKYFIFFSRPRAPVSEHATHKNEPVAQVESVFECNRLAIGILTACHHEVKNACCSRLLQATVFCMMAGLGRKRSLGARSPLATKTRGSACSARHDVREAPQATGAFSRDTVNFLWVEGTVVSREHLEEPPLVFMNVQGKPGKNDLAASSQVRAHAMRKVQHQRRMKRVEASKIQKSKTKHQCNHAEGRKSDSSGHGKLVPGPDSLTFPQNAPAPQNMFVGSNNAQAGVSMVCKQCEDAGHIF
ncbi:hypothetical protein BDZ45DRAFT_676387, partial [Acephala macrosclerotiorum]